MSSHLVSMLHHEERSLVAELRASRPFQRLEGIRKLLALYDAQPSVATGLDVPATEEAEAGGGDVIPLSAAAAAAPAAVASAIPLPGPVSAPAPHQVSAMATAAVAEAARSAGPTVAMAESHGESASVVSSVRAALLGIGKG